MLAQIEQLSEQSYAVISCEVQIKLGHATIDMD